MVLASDYFLNEVFVFQNIENSSNLVEYFSKLPQLNSFQTILGYQFKDLNLLFNVFCHKSFAHEAKWEISNNERLEFLGDSVLQLIVSQKLMHRYPEKKEGDLSKLRSSIVNAQTLAKLALLLKLDQLILLGKGEFNEHGYKKESLLADAFEALLGALYLESGIEECQRVILQSFAEYHKKTGDDLLGDQILMEFDAKSRLQELVMQLYKEHPVYESEEIKEKKKTFFKVTLLIKNKILNSTTNESKKKAMQILAKEAINKKLYQL